MDASLNLHSGSVGDPLVKKLTVVRHNVLADLPICLASNAHSETVSAISSEYRSAPWESHLRTVARL